LLRPSGSRISAFHYSVRVHLSAAGTDRAALSQREHQPEREQQRDRDFYNLPNIVNSEDWSNTTNHLKSNGLGNG